MSVYRIAVLSDTHVPQCLPELPKQINQIFRGVDLIVHCGDINSLQVLDELRQLAPVVAVKGQHDPLSLRLKEVFQVGKMRFGLTHGRRVWDLSISVVNDRFAGHYFWWGGLQRYLLHVFRQEEVNAIIFGHFHHTYQKHHKGVLLFSPGAIFHRSVEWAKAQLSSKKLSFIQRVILQDWLRREKRIPSLNTGPPTVGLLTIKQSTIHAEVIRIPN